MKKYIVYGFVSFGVLVSPIVTQAASLTSSQVQSILSLLSSFGADSATIANVQAALTGGNFCYNFSTNLRIGNSGSAVTALQTALQKDGESVVVNGTFDDQTASAVTGFQQKYASDILTPNGLQYGTGYAGPSTRAKLNSLYGCSSQTTPSSMLPISFTATPTSGAAPLTVNFSTPFEQTKYAPIVVFGDGSQSYMSCPRDGCVLSHAYTNAGTYTAQLTEYSSVVVNTATITVTGETATTVPTISYVQAPAANINVIQSGEQTRIFGNSFPANSTVTIVIDNYSASGQVSSDGTQVTFIVPTIPAGNYDLYVTGSGFQTSTVTVSVPCPNNETWNGNVCVG
jgi:peptidoglycan hydrolase-like protein with peptidoglycan-binding domain